MLVLHDALPIYVVMQQFSDKNKAPGNCVIRVSKVEIRVDDRPVTGAIDGQTDLFFMFSFWNLSEAHSPMSVNIVVINFLGEGIFSTTSEQGCFQDGLIHGMCHVTKGFLADGSYVVHFVFLQDNQHTLFEVRKCVV